MSKWNLIINVGRCENCNNCVLAERDEHVGNDFPGYAAPAAPSRRQPDPHPAPRPGQRAHGGDDLSAGDVQPLRRRTLQCATGARHPQARRRHRHHRSGEGRGRKDIVAPAPISAIVWNEEQQVPQTWIFDAHLLDQGWSRPRCQQACPTDVFEAVKLDDRAMEEKADAGRARGAAAQVGYQAPRLVPGLERWETCFVGGSVSADLAGSVECIEGADVTGLTQPAKFARCSPTASATFASTI